MTSNIQKGEFKDEAFVDDLSQIAISLKQAVVSMTCLIQALWYHKAKLERAYHHGKSPTYKGRQKLKEKETIKIQNNQKKIRWYQ